MTFHIATLEHAIGHSDEQAFLFRALVQAFIDHGASRQNLEELLADAKNNRAFFNTLAKRVMGRIWELTEETVDLSWIDFDAPPKTILGQYPGFRIHGVYQKSLFEGRWVENRPKGPCRYKLAHQSSSVHAAELFRNSEISSIIGYAGWRELAAYTTQLKPGDLKHCRIFGLATPEIQPLWKEADTFFYLCEKLGDIELSAFVTGSGWLDESCFHLVRVYES